MRTRSVVVLAIALPAVLAGGIAGPRAQDGAGSLEDVRQGLGRGMDRAVMNRRVSEPPMEQRGPGSTVYKDRVNGVVVVGAGEAIGTGALISREGDIITNEHVVQDAFRARGAEWVAIWFKPKDGDAFDPKKFMPARVMKRDPRKDLALVRLAEAVPADATTIPVGGTRPEVGGDVFAIGHPRALFWTLTQGIVSAIRPGYEWQADDGVKRGPATAIQTQAPINPGNSGGPLLDSSGRIIGIVAFSRVDSQGLFFAIDADHVRELLASPVSDPGPAAAPPTGRAPQPTPPAGGRPTDASGESRSAPKR